MANRSCLYACDRLPSRDSEEPVRFTGICEHKWDVPFIQKLLLTGNPRACKSTVWDWEEDIAIAGDFDAGVAALKTFLLRIDNDTTHALVEETLAYIEGLDPDTKYFVLEVGEILELDGAEFPDQIAKLLQDIQGLKDAPAYAQALQIATGTPQKQSGFLGMLFGAKKETDPLEGLYDLGLGYWSDVLYFDPNEGHGEGDDDEPPLPVPLSKEEIPGSLNELLAAFKTAFDGGDHDALDGLVYWGDVAEASRKVMRDYDLQYAKAGELAIVRFSVTPYHDYYHAEYRYAAQPAWAVEWEAATEKMSITTELFVGEVDGSCRILCRLSD